MVGFVQGEILIKAVVGGIMLGFVAIVISAAAASSTLPENDPANERSRLGEVRLGGPLVGGYGDGGGGGCDGGGGS
jgi:hypothetical protein